MIATYKGKKNRTTVSGGLQTGNTRAVLADGTSSLFWSTTAFPGLRRGRVGSSLTPR